MLASELIVAIQEQIDMCGDKKIEIHFDNQGDWGSSGVEFLHHDPEDNENVIVITGICRS